MSSSKKHKGCLRRVLDMVLAAVLAVVAVFAITNVVTIVGSKGSIVTPEKASIGNADAIVVLGRRCCPMERPPVFWPIA